MTLEMADDTIAMADDTPGSPEAVIGDKIAESIGQLDIMSTLKKMVVNSPDGEASLEATQKLENIMERYNQMTVEEREQFTKTIKDNLMMKLKEGLGSKLKEGLGSKITLMTQEVQAQIMWRLGIFLFLAVVVLVLIVFFGYKLYKSIRDKEVKKEEKKKQRQLKKKK